ncbi:MAG: hypothetical protein ACRC14_04700 [Paracoccaceae bacterium]
MLMRYVPDGKVLTDCFWDRSRLSIIQGPIQSGTSTMECHKIWVLAEEQAPDNDGVRRSRWIITRDTYKDLKETTIKTWLEWFPEHVWGQMIRAEPSTHHLKRPHSSGDGTFVDCEVIFLALPDPDVAEKVLASYEITGFFRNEGQFVEKRVIDELLSRCARYPSKRNGPGATWFGGMIDLNAPVEGHWIPYMRGDIPIPADWTDEQRAVFKKPTGWKFFLQPPGLVEAMVDGKIVYSINSAAENQKHTRQSYLEIVEGKDKSWIDQRVMNRIGVYVNGKAVYPTFFPGDHVALNDAAPVPGLPIVCGLDFGREPAAAFLQCVNGCWRLLSELIGSNESAKLFAPRVKRHLAEKYPGHKVEFWGDPRGADKGQNDETTAYDIFRHEGMVVMPATTDNNPEMRRSAIEAVLQRRNGFKVNPSVITAKIGFGGGYHYPKIKGTGMFSERPRKNLYSHIVEAVENAVLGGGEGDAIVQAPAGMRSSPSPVKRHKVILRKLAAR